MEYAQQPVCSIIIPVFNAEEYLKQCVESVLAQTCGYYELILVDDGSEDGSGELCDQYASGDRRIRVLHQKNSGHTLARNAGLRAAQGEYVVFFDSDDWVDSDLLSDCFESIQKYHPDVILYGYRRINGSKTADHKQPFPAGYYDRRKIEQTILPELLICGHFSLCERMVRRELLIKHQFQVDPEILLGEDLAVCVCSMSEARSAVILSDCYYNYLQHPTSVSHTHQNYTFTNWMLLRDHLNSHLAGMLPEYAQQRGTCSIRFLQRAVLGEVERRGFHFHVLRDISRQLSEPEIQEDIRNAKFPQEKKSQRFKQFCLKYRLAGSLYLADSTIAWLRRLGGSL